jgi:LIVCS family branched-chain amino acid:cation transporter
LQHGPPAQNSRRFFLLWIDEMKKFMHNSILPVSLAIFSMFFGAGDLIFAVFVGKEYQSQTPLALAGFLVTAACLPILGVVSILAYQGDYRAFFYRIGKMPGTLLAFASLIVIGPLVAMPRIVSFSYSVIEPLVPSFPLWLFALLFLGLTFLLTMSESRIIDVLGLVVSPILVISLLVIFASAILQPSSWTVSQEPALDVVIDNIKYGYNTLNFLSAIFFGAVVVSILKKAGAANHEESSQKQVLALGFKASLFGVALLALIYVGLALTGARHSQGLGGLNERLFFNELMTRMLGEKGAMIPAIAVLMACLSTIIALSAAAAEFLHENIFVKRVSYVVALILSLLVAGCISVLGLDAIIEYSGPILSTLHPVVITLALANLAYKWFKFPFVKIPVAVALVLSIWAHRGLFTNLF